ncbi:MAG: hypothetical protein QM727_05405 [Niabella sp.]
MFLGLPQCLYICQRAKALALRHRAIRCNLLLRYAPQKDFRFYPCPGGLLLSLSPPTRPQNGW